MDQSKLLTELLQSWEDTYKKGQLTLWIFLALKHAPKYVDEIKAFISEKTRGTLLCEEQSLYRALRKYEYINVVSFELRKGNKGPDRKYYVLTPLGEALFSEFVQRNITLFYQEEFINLLNEK